MVKSLILDASPLITTPASVLQGLAKTFYTTPGVYGELKDEQLRNQLLLWGDALKIRQPKPEFISKVHLFAKMTGDSTVLSLNDVHIIALAYEIEAELNGVGRLRTHPGQQLPGDKAKEERREERKEAKNDSKESEPKERLQENNLEATQKEEVAEENSTKDEDDGFTTVNRRVRKTRKHWRDEHIKRREEREAEKQKESKKNEENEKVENEENEKEENGEKENEEKKEEKTKENTELSAEYDEDDDDGEWITPENLQEELLKDKGEVIQDNNTEDVSVHQEVAFATGDFACQNVAMQIGISLMNYTTGKQIMRVRNYMYRCHACFRLTPIPKSGQAKHFCPKCGGATLLRCAVSIDQDTGKITPHLKTNFIWINRGNKYSLPSPLSKNQTKRVGQAGYQHNKNNRHKMFQNPELLREDQKEYTQALKDEEWQRRQNEKMMLEWIGGGSADNFVSPFSLGNARTGGVKVNKGRYANASKKRR